MARTLYDDNIKREIGLRFLNGRSLRSLASQYAIHYQTLKNWKKVGFCYRNYDLFNGDRQYFYMSTGEHLFAFERTRIKTPTGIRWALILVGQGGQLPMQRFASWYI